MSADDPLTDAAMFARVAVEMATQTDLNATGQRVVELARSVLACDSTAMWSLVGDNRVRLHAATDGALAARFSGVITDLKEGLSWECLRTRSTVVVTDIREDHRWPAYREFVLNEPEPFLSAVGYCLAIDGRSLGAIVMASRQPRYFTEQRIRIGEIFAEHAAISVEAVTAGARAAHLESALVSNRRIGMAIGILMTSLRCTEQRAFDLLRVRSQDLHLKIKDIAEEVILTGQLRSGPGTT